jgi:hypothetical protein
MVLGSVGLVVGGLLLVVGMVVKNRRGTVPPAASLSKEMQGYVTDDGPQVAIAVTNPAGAEANPRNSLIVL